MEEEKRNMKCIISTSFIPNLRRKEETRRKRTRKERNVEEEEEEEEDVKRYM